MNTTPSSLNLQPILTLHNLTTTFVLQTNDYIDMLSQSIRGSVAEHNKNRETAAEAAEQREEEEGSNYFTTPEQSDGDEGMDEIEEGEEEYEEEEEEETEEEEEEETEEDGGDGGAVTASASKKHNELLERMQGLRNKMKNNGDGGGEQAPPAQAEQFEGYAVETPAKQAWGSAAGQADGVPTPAKDAPEVAAHEFTSKSGGLPTPWEQQGGIAPPPKYYHVSNPVSRGAASTRSPQRMDPPTHPEYAPDYKPSEEQGDGDGGGEDMYNRLKQAWSSNRSNDGSVSVKSFKQVTPPTSSFAGAGGAKAKSGRRRKSKAASQDEDPKKMETFHRLYDDHARMEKTRSKQREKKEQQEVKYMQKKSFKVTGKSTEMLSRNTSAPTDVGARLHKHAIQKRNNEEKLTIRKHELEKQKETWSCPRCNFENAFDATTCRNITGRTVPHDQEHPTSWIHADIEKVKDTATAPGGVVIYCSQPRPEADFVPTNLSEHSRKLIKGWRRTETVWDTLHSNAAAEEKRRHLIDAHMEDHNAELTLQPHIPSTSRALVSERRILNEKGDGAESLSQQDANIALYELAKEKRGQRDEKHRTRYDNLPFAPDIGKSKLRDVGDENQKTFVQRLSQEHIDREERLRALRDKHISDHDPTTGMEYFKPLTGRAPMAGNDHGHRAHGNTVHEALHAHHEHVENKVRHMQEFSQVEVEMKASKSHVTRKVSR